MTVDRVGRPVPSVTFADIAHLPVIVDLLTAARVLGIGRTTAYALARAEEFPCAVVRVGGVYRVPTVGLLRLVGLDTFPTPHGEQGSGHGAGHGHDSPHGGDISDDIGRGSGVDRAPDRGRSRLGLPRGMPAARA